jgi:hypothetical protein
MLTMEFLLAQCSTLPPSVLPDISPAWGEISQSQMSTRVISPLAGEMSGRTEGGATEHRASIHKNGSDR